MDCERQFDEPKIVEQAAPYGMGSAAEKWAVCPFCSSANIIRAAECEHCGEYTIELKQGLCDCCYADIYGGENNV
jgi:hypothetical protein